MATLEEIVDAAWATEIQPGLTAAEIVAAWLEYEAIIAVVDAVWLEEIQPGLTAAEIMAAWFAYLEGELQSQGGGPDDDDIERWHAAGRKAAARFAPIEVPVIKVTDEVRTATTSSPSPPKQFTQNTDEQDEFDLMVVLLLV